MSDKNPNGVFDKLPKDVSKTMISQYCDTKSLSILTYRISKGINALFRQSFGDRIYPMLLQAVVDDNQEQVQNILNLCPELLLKIPEKKLTIESQYTWQTFYPEYVLYIAIMRDQLEMVKILLPYFKKIKNVENVDEEFSKQWNSAWEDRNILKYGYHLAPMSDKVELKENTIYVAIEGKVKFSFINSHNEKTTIYENIKLKYSVINPKGETVNGEIPLEDLGYRLKGVKSRSLNNIEDLENFEALIQYLPKILEVTSKRGHTLEEKTKQYAAELKSILDEINKGENEGQIAISNFRKKYLPKEAIRLNKCVNVEDLLYEAYNVYEKEYHDDFCTITIDKRSQCEKYSIQIIGFLQSLLIPGTAKKFCQSLHHTIQLKKPISSKAMNLKLIKEEDVSFYRKSPNSCEGLGFDFLCGEMFDKGCMIYILLGASNTMRYYQKLLQSKALEFTQLNQLNPVLNLETSKSLTL